MSEQVADLLTIAEVERRARAVVEPGAFAWAAAGAGEEVTLRRNRAALSGLALVPRVLRDVAEVDLSTSFAGVPLSLPLTPAPIGALGLYHPGDALAAAEAAARLGTAAFCSMLTSSRWEAVAASAPGRHFFQMFMEGDEAWAAGVVDRAHQAGFAGICLTVDSPAIGRRDRVLERRYRWTPRGGEAGLGRHGSDPSHRSRVTWDHLSRLCAKAPLPVVIKGVMTADDAARAVAAGVSGIYVSNHGGRVLDHEVSTVEVLEEVVSAAQGVDVMVDGGFRRGADVCKAIALGAKAVGLGRLQCWGLAVGGAEGVTRVLEILEEEIRVTMANLGCADLSQLTRDRVRWSQPIPPEPRSGLL